MATKNDNTILLLKDKIAQKRKELGPEPKFTPETTCIFNLYGDKVNIHTLDESRVMFYLVHFKSMIDASKDIVDLSPERIIIDGYSIVEWYSDLLNKYFAIQWVRKSKDLTALEQKLDKLLSSDKKVELELADIANLIG